LPQPAGSPLKKKTISSVCIQQNHEHSTYSAVIYFVNEIVKPLETSKQCTEADKPFFCEPERLEC
uniref:Uncharacterized protein n=1 Tax=Oryza brachyantha TaxID=4533 RepID=J3N088_ORYBR